MRLETFLRLADIPHEVITLADPRKAPKGKLPYIEDDGEVIADSHICMRHLTEKYGITLDDRLSPPEKATGYALQRMLDEGFIWTMVYNRWMDERIWPTLKRGFFGALPPVMRQILPAMIRRGFVRTLHGQGMGRHDKAEIYRQSKECLQAVSDYLSDKPYLFGDEPTSYDATAYAFVANALQVPFDTELQQARDDFPNLLSYCERMRERCFAD